MLLAVGFVLTFGTSVFARPHAEQTLPAGHKSEERLIFVTGSLIPQRVELRALGTATVSPLRIFSRREIDGRGRLTIQETLLTDPAVRILGR